MFELTHVAGDTYYIESPAKIGLYAPNGNAYLIDSGNDKDAGRKIGKILDEKGWGLKGIINTHSNADHIGGNAFLVRKYGCPVYSPKTEAAFNEFPSLESSFLYGGYPPKELRRKFLCAEPSKVDFGMETLPCGLKSLPLPGHFFNMAGIVTPDNICFLADSLFGEATLSKYSVFFVYDVGGFLETINQIEAMEYKIYIPSHAACTADIKPLCQMNRDKIFEIMDVILECCKEPTSFDMLLKMVFDHFNLTMTFDQYVLVGSTVRSYLSYLLDSGKVNRDFEQNILTWKRV